MITAGRVLNFFNRKDNDVLALTGGNMALRPMMTLGALEGIRRQVRLNPLAGKGAYTIEQLENDAILAHYNTCVAEDATQVKTPAPPPIASGTKVA